MRVPRELRCTTRTRPSAPDQSQREVPRLHVPFSHLLRLRLPPGAAPSFDFFDDVSDEFSSLNCFLPSAPSKCLFLGCIKIAGILIGIGPVGFGVDEAVARLLGFCRAGSSGAEADRVDAMSAASAGEGAVSSGMARCVS